MPKKRATVKVKKLKVSTSVFDFDDENDDPVTDFQSKVSKFNRSKKQKNRKLLRGNEKNLLAQEYVSTESQNQISEETASTSKIVSSVSIEINSCIVCNEVFLATANVQTVTDHVNACLDKQAIGENGPNRQVPDDHLLPQENTEQDQMLALKLQSQEHEIRNQRKMNDDMIECQFCKKDLSKMNSIRKSLHVNKCCDSFSEQKKFDEVKQKQIQTEEKNRSLTCVICGNVSKTAKALQSHLKKCAKKNEVPTVQLLNLLKTQSDGQAALTISKNNVCNPVNVPQMRRLRGRKKDLDCTNVLPPILMKDDEKVNAELQNKARIIKKQALDSINDDDIQCTPAMQPSYVVANLEREESDPSDFDSDEDSSERDTEAEAQMLASKQQTPLLWEMSSLQQSSTDEKQFIVHSEIGRYFTYFESKQSGIEETEKSNEMTNSKARTNMSLSVNCESSESEISSKSEMHPIRNNDESTDKKNSDNEEVMSNSDKDMFFPLPRDPSSMISCAALCATEEAITMTKEEHRNSIPKKLYAALKREDTCDLNIFVSNGEKVLAHNTILMLLAPSVAKNIEAQSSSSENQMKWLLDLSEYSKASVLCILKWIYSGECDFDNVNINEVSKISRRYQLHDFENLCDCHKDVISKYPQKYTKQDDKSDENNEMYGFIYPNKNEEDDNDKVIDNPVNIDDIFNNESNSDNDNDDDSIASTNDEYLNDSDAEENIRQALLAFDDDDVRDVEEFICTQVGCHDNIKNDNDDMNIDEEDENTDSSSISNDVSISSDTPMFDDTIISDNALLEVNDDNENPTLSTINHDDSIIINIEKSNIDGCEDGLQCDDSMYCDKKNEIVGRMRNHTSVVKSNDDTVDLNDTSTMGDKLQSSIINTEEYLSNTNFNDSLEKDNNMIINESNEETSDNDIKNESIDMQQYQPTQLLDDRDNDTLSITSDKEVNVSNLTLSGNNGIHHGVPHDIFTQSTVLINDSDEDSKNLSMNSDQQINVTDQINDEILEDSDDVDSNILNDKENNSDAESNDESDTTDTNAIGIVSMNDVDLHAHPAQSIEDETCDVIVYPDQEPGIADTSGIDIGDISANINNRVTQPTDHNSDNETNINTIDNDRTETIAREDDLIMVDDSDENDEKDSTDIASHDKYATNQIDAEDMLYDPFESPTKNPGTPCVIDCDTPSLENCEKSIFSSMEEERTHRHMSPITEVNEINNAATDEAEIDLSESIIMELNESEELFQSPNENVPKTTSNTSLSRNVSSTWNNTPHNTSSVKRFNDQNILSEIHNTISSDEELNKSHTSNNSFDISIESISLGQDYDDIYLLQNTSSTRSCSTNKSPCLTNKSSCSTNKSPCPANKSPCLANKSPCLSSQRKTSIRNKRTSLRFTPQRTSTVSQTPKNNLYVDDDSMDFIGGIDQDHCTWENSPLSSLHLNEKQKTPTIHHTPITHHSPVANITPLTHDTDDDIDIPDPTSSSMYVTPDDVREKYKSFKPGCNQHPETGNVITPMPNFTEMQTPALKKKMKEHGIRPMKKKHMAGKLVEIYKYTHEFRKWEEQPDKPKRRRTETSTSTVATNSKRRKIASNVTQQVNNPEDEIESGGNSDEDIVITSNVKSKKDHIQKSTDQTNMESCSDGSDYESLDELPKCGGSELDKKLISFLRENEKWYLKVLTYQPIDVNEFSQSVRDAGIKCGMIKLKAFLDKQCICSNQQQVGKQTRRCGSKKK